MNRWELTRWLIGHTRALLGPLALAAALRTAGHLLTVALFVTALTGLVAAAGGVLVGRLTLTLTVLALVKSVLRYLEQYSGHYVAFTALQRLRELFFARLIPQAPAATQGAAGAELTDRATRDIDRIEVFFAHTFPPAVATVLVPTTALLWLGTAVSWPLAGALAPFALGAIVLPVLTAPLTWNASTAVARAHGDLAAELGDDIQGIHEVLAFATEQDRLTRLDAADARVTAARQQLGRIQALRAAVKLVLQAGGLIAVVAVGGGLAEVAAALGVGIGLWRSVSGIDDFATGLDAAFASASRVREIVDATPVVREPDNPASPPRPGTGTAEVSAVTFRYPGSVRPALVDVSIAFPAGSWSCVAGVSGSGKSTLAALLVRGWDADAGTVRIDGAAVQTFSLEDLRRRVAYVPQHPVLLTGTLADNLRLGAPTAVPAALHAAVRNCALEDWLAQLPDGLDTRVGPGFDVSGGQLQRLALARALVSAPEILVLDEALSQVDGPTAARVRANLAAAGAGLTTIEITHRADLIPDATPVFVLDAGRLVAAGPAGVLRREDGPFRLLEARA